MLAAPQKFVFKELQLKAWEKLKGLEGKKDEAFQHVQLNQIDPIVGELGEIKCSHPNYFISLGQAKSLYGLYLNERLASSIRKSQSVTMLMDHAHLSGGGMLYLPRGTCEETPIYIEMVGNGPLHLFVVAEEGVSAQVVMHPKMQQCYLDFNVHKGANLKWKIERTETITTSELIHIEADQQRDSSLELINLTVGSKLSRISFDANLNGEGAHCDFKGFAALREKDQAHVYAKINHNAPNTQSNQLVHHLLCDRAKASFTGKIYVDSVAQQTQAYQLNKNLLLSPSAVAHAKPGLEIFADDVKASHGATIASIDEELRFYFHSRGLSSEASRQFLMRAFTDPLIGNDPTWHSIIEAM